MTSDIQVPDDVEYGVRPCVALPTRFALISRLYGFRPTTEIVASYTLRLRTGLPLEVHHVRVANRPELWTTAHVWGHGRYLGSLVRTAAPIRAAFWCYPGTLAETPLTPFTALRAGQYVHTFREGLHTLSGARLAQDGAKDPKDRMDWRDGRRQATDTQNERACARHMAGIGLSERTVEQARRYPIPNDARYDVENNITWTVVAVDADRVQTMGGRHGRRTFTRKSWASRVGHVHIPSGGLRLQVAGGTP